MKKKRVRIIAAILTGTALIMAAVPAVLAERASDASDGTAKTETSVTESRQRDRGRGAHARPEEPAEPENAIGKDAAKEIALNDGGFTSEQVERVRARLSDRDGNLVYRVSFNYDGQRYSYKIDPVSGEILNKTVGKTTEHSHDGHGSHERPEEPAEPENAIGKDAAKEIALADAGLTSEQVERVRARLSDRDGTVVYKVSFRYDGQRYSYKIDPVNGEILDKTVGEATGHSHGGHGHDGGAEAPAEGAV
ncbi:MAG: PepSY domain-containing protein [Clostridiales bacterium]|nr:PepSY domain-containing protein [Clostridiales bacterium]